MFPKAPRLQTRPHAEIGPPRTRTARRSVPTSEVFGLHPGGQKPTVSDGVKTNENRYQPNFLYFKKFATNETKAGAISA